MAGEFIDAPAPQFIDAPGPQFVDQAAPDKSRSDGWTKDPSVPFKVRRIVTPDTQRPTFQREDGAIYYGPEQGNQGKPGWFNAQGQPAGDVPQSMRKPTIVEHVMFSTPMQAVTDIPMSAMQLASQIPGVPKTARDWVQKLAMERESAYQRNPENRNIVGDINRGIIQSVVGGRLVPAMAATGGNLVAQGAAAGMLQPVTGSAEEVPGEKLQQGAFGAGAGLVGKGLTKVIPKIGEVGKRFLTTGDDFSPEAVLSKFKGKVGGKASDVIQEDLNAQYGAARREASEAFKNLRTEAGGVEVPVNQYTSKLDELIAREEASRAGADKTVVGKLKELREALDNPNADKSFGGTIDVGSRLNAIYGDAVSGQQPNRHLAGTVKELKTALQSDLDNAGGAFGQQYLDAKKLWQQKVVPWEDPHEGGRLLQNFIKSPTPDQAMDALLKAKSEDKLKIFVDKLSKDKGIPALQAGLVENVYKQSLDESGKVIPAKFMGALKARREAYDLAFYGEAKWRMDGLTNLLRDSNFTARFLTGEFLRNIPGGRILPGSAYPTPDAGSMLQKLFTTPQVSKLLVEAQGAKPNTEAMRKIVERITNKIAPSVSSIKAGMKQEQEQIQEGGE